MHLKKRRKNAIFWNNFFFLFLDGQSDVEVHLVVRKYVEKGSSVTLHCEHNVPEKILYKVSETFYIYKFTNSKIGATASCNWTC